MKINPAAIPPGTRTFLFEEAAQRRELEQAIFGALRRRGFQEIDTPLFDYYESASIGLNQEERNRIIRFTESDTGQAIALRTDITSQIARSAATHLAQRPLPLRLCYSGPVFRRAQKGKGEQYVIHQAGMEIVGHAGPEADIELLLCIKTILDGSFCRGWALSLGHAGVIGSFLKGIPPETAEKIKHLLAKKDKGALAAAIKTGGLSTAAGEKIAAIADLFGGGEVLEKANAIVKDAPEAMAALKNLSAVFTALDNNGFKGKLSIDLGEMRGFGYYTGLIIELFSETGVTLGNGGRYDNLVKRFGPDLPAVGFAFDIDTMIDTIMRGAKTEIWRGADYLLPDPAHAALAENIRKAGYNLAVPFKRMDRAEALEFARKMNIPKILDVAADGGLRSLDVAGGAEKAGRFEELFGKKD